jgi:hypothetical protein
MPAIIFAVLIGAFIWAEMVLGDKPRRQDVAQPFIPEPQTVYVDRTVDKPVVKVVEKPVVKIVEKVIIEERPVEKVVLVEVPPKVDPRKKKFMSDCQATRLSELDCEKIWRDDAQGR